MQSAILFTASLNWSLFHVGLFRQLKHVLHLHVRQFHAWTFRRSVIFSAPASESYVLTCGLGGVGCDRRRSDGEWASSPMSRYLRASHIATVLCVNQDKNHYQQQSNLDINHKRRHSRITFDFSGSSFTSVQISKHTQTEAWLTCLVTRLQYRSSMPAIPHSKDRISKGIKSSYTELESLGEHKHPMT